MVIFRKKQSKYRNVPISNVQKCSNHILFEIFLLTNSSNWELKDFKIPHARSLSTKTRAHYILKVYLCKYGVVDTLYLIKQPALVFVLGVLTSLVGSFTLSFCSFSQSWNTTFLGGLFSISSFSDSRSTSVSSVWASWISSWLHKSQYFLLQRGL